MSASFPLPVVILAGGLATRLGALTATVPKALLPVAGQPFLTHQLRLLREQGIEQVVLCVGHLGEMIAEQFGDGRDHGVQLRYSYDGPILLGTGGALRQALPLLGQHFFVLYGDSYLPIPFAPVADAFSSSRQRGLMTVFRNEDRFDSSNVWFEEGRIKRYDKRERTPQMHHIDYGLSAFVADVFSSRPPGQKFDLADVMQELLGSGELAGYEVRERFYEIGSRAGLQELEALLTKPK